MVLTNAQRDAAVSHFKQVQNDLSQALELVDGAAHFERKSWSRPPLASGEDGGGGTMAVCRGACVEKAGVNVSAVRGDQYPAIEGEHKDKPYFAAGVSTICHMYNPHAPIAHMNVRLLQVGERFWVGGGADLTPFVQYEEDTRAFHGALEEACDGFEQGAYGKYRKWCSEYFYIPHRKEERGVGGIFFDYLEGDFDTLLGFLKAVTDAYVRIYPEILRRRKDLPFSEEDKEGQLRWRGRYAEFNLAYDRGTKFGLMTGGNIEAIFVSLPPVVKW